MYTTGFFLLYWELMWFQGLGILSIAPVYLYTLFVYFFPRAHSHLYCMEYYIGIKLCHRYTCIQIFFFIYSDLLDHFKPFC